MHGPMKLSIKVTSAVVVVGLAVVGCGGSSGASSAKKVGPGTSGGKSSTVTIGIISPVAPFALPQIATDHHLWPKGVTVHAEEVSASTGPALISTGKIDLLLGAPPDIDIAANKSGAAVGWVGEWGSPADFEMLARPGISSLAALKGKAIGGIFPGASVDVLASVALARAGLKVGDYKSLPLGSVSGMESAFISRSVDAFVMTRSSVDQVAQKVKGSKVLYDFYTARTPWISAGAIAYKPWASRNSSTLTEVLGSMSNALVLAHRDPAAVAPSIAKVLGVGESEALAQTKAFVERAPAHIEPVTAAALRPLYALVRDALESKYPTASFASSMADPSYAQAIGH